jgi:SAM-dependent methyltransferase
MPWKMKPLLSRVAYKAIRPLIGDRIKQYHRDITNERILESPHIAGKFLSLQGSKAYSVIPLLDPPTPPVSHDNLPVPPQSLWLGYGDTPEEYLEGGRVDIAMMLDILKNAGALEEMLLRVLDFGCGAARMLRYFPYVEGRSELWGVDISAAHITWCQQHLSPPFSFVTTTTAPHLPFEDNYFDLVYCGSVFTHISDLADAWFLELRRILRRGGYAFISIHDQHTIDLWATTYKHPEWARKLLGMIRRVAEETPVLSRPYACLSIDAGSQVQTQVFYNTDYLVNKWSRWATCMSVTQEGYGPHTVLLFRK